MKPEDLAQQGAGMAISNPAFIGPILGGCGCLLIFFFLGGSIALGMFAMNNSGGGGGSGDDPVTTACGTGVETLVSGVPMFPLVDMDDMSKVYTEGKLGHEQHCRESDVKPSHFGTGSDVGFVPDQCSFRPHTTDQEHWYFNAAWFGWINDGNEFDTRKGAAEARKAVKHAKVIVTNPENGLSIVTSVEEFGPGRRIINRDGIPYGASVEVYKYLKTADPYTGNPSDKKGLVKVSFAQDQNVKLGPCK